MIACMGLEHATAITYPYTTLLLDLLISLDELTEGFGFFLLNENLPELAGYVEGTLWAHAQQYFSDVPQGPLFHSYASGSAANAL